jgi:hypothetical protein
MLALLAIFVLVVQALAPAAMAAPLAGPGFTICAPGVMGHQDGGGPPASAHSSCQHCLCPAPAAPPPEMLRVERVAYARVDVPAAVPRDVRAPPARAPPRPPGQGPPFPNA